MIKTAEISPCGRYRYLLTRSWQHFQAARWALFVMLNPSTADAEHDDPTITRCIGFAKSWGFHGLVVVNLYAWRATNPKELPVGIAGMPCPVGPQNDTHVRAALATCEIVVCAWGKPGPYPSRRTDTLQLIREAGHQPLALKINKDGNPGHPLYLPAASNLVALA